MDPDPRSDGFPARALVVALVLAGALAGGVAAASGGPPAERGGPAPTGSGAAATQSRCYASSPDPATRQLAVGMAC